MKYDLYAARLIIISSMRIGDRFVQNQQHNPTVKYVTFRNLTRLSQLSTASHFFFS